MDVMLTTSARRLGNDQIYSPTESPARGADGPVHAHSRDSSPARDLRNPRTSHVRVPTSPRQRLFLFAELANDGFERVDDFVPIDAGLGETQPEVELFGRRPVREHELFGTPGARPRRFLAQLLPRRTALAGNFLDEGRHFLGCILPNHL